MLRGEARHVGAGRAGWVGGGCDTLRLPGFGASPTAPENSVLAMDETFRRPDSQLHASPAFHGLAEEARIRLTEDVVTVAAFLRPPASPPRAGKGRPGLDRKLATRPDMLPEFVSELVTGTFQAVVDATAEQMDAYAALMGRVAASIEGLWADAEQRTLLALKLEGELQAVFGAPRER